MAQDNKFLTFKLDNENYGIPIIKVKEIVGMMAITKVPRLPEFIKGVINLKGKIIPLIDLRIKFGLDEREYDERTSVIVMEMQLGDSIKTNGVIVDIVDEVLDIPADSVENPPKYGGSVDQEYLTGIGKVKEEIIMLIDVEKVFTAEEKEVLQTAKEK